MGRILGGIEQDSELWIRQIAWLQTPIDPEFKPSKKSESRISSNDQKDFLSQIHPDAYSSYLISLAQSMGLYKNSGFGHEPISWSEMKAWSEITNTKITPWEAKVLMKLSIAFVYQMSISKNSSCISPVVEVDEDELKLRRSNISNAFKMMAKAARRKK